MSDTEIHGDGTGRALPEFDGAREREAKGDDGMTDDERRLAKQRARDAEQKKVDAAGDAVRADMERANGEAEGSRGRNAEPEKPVKATPRKAQASGK